MKVTGAYGGAGYSSIIKTMDGQTLKDAAKQMKLKKSEDKLSYSGENRVNFESNTNSLEKIKDYQTEISKAQEAEKGLDEIGSLVEKLKDLNTRSFSDTIVGKEAYDTQVKSLLSQIDQVAMKTRDGHKELLAAVNVNSLGLDSYLETVKDKEDLLNSAADKVNKNKMEYQSILQRATSEITKLKVAFENNLAANSIMTGDEELFNKTFDLIVNNSDKALQAQSNVSQERAINILSNN